MCSIRPISVRYESAVNSFFTAPFETGLRHLKVACCDGSQDALLQLAKERIIYRPQYNAKDNAAYEPLTTRQRVCHAIVGALETVGYLFLIVPFIVSIADKILNKPFYPKGCYEYRTHMEEGGKSGVRPASWRKSPFDKDSEKDPFYRGASWLKANQSVFA